MGTKLKFISILFISGILLVFGVSCQKKTKEDKAFAKVGSKVLSQDDFNAFRRMRGMYPSNLAKNIFPSNRSEVSQCVETAVLFKKAESAVAKEVKNSLDWQWKKRFYPAMLYLSDVLDKNWGFLDKDIENYYNAHKEEYKQVVQTTVTDSTQTDSTKRTVTKDSVYYKPLNVMRGEIGRMLFLAENPPPASFYESLYDLSDTSVVIDSARVQGQWCESKRRDLPNYCMKKSYTKRFGKELPDSLKEYYGEGKIITPADIDVILNWLPESAKEQYKTMESQRFLVEWLLKWKLFSDDANQTGFTKSQMATDVSAWAWKYEVVMYYVNTSLLAKFKKDITIDTMMCVYENWDNTSRPEIYPDSASMANIVESQIKARIQVVCDEFLYNERKKAGVAFLQSDYVDGLVENPDSLAIKADSLYGAGNSNEAETIYAKLVDNFPFHPKGVSGLVELAKIFTEKERYTDAIKNYRRYLLLSNEPDKRCNIFFMIGFVYGEYLSRPELAEASYKWILKNSPDCELSDDAEFMCLHLDEPMIGVDELQAEAKRQGRKVEDAEPVSVVEENKDKS